jgi:hypothetical protein
MDLKVKSGIGIALLSMLLFLVNCRMPQSSVHNVDILSVIEERDIIPEGTAYDPVSDQVFISCMYKRKIIAIRKDGTYYDFIHEGQDSIWAPMGMEVDAANHKLWVISGKGKQGIVTRLKPADPSWEARLYRYDIPSGRLNNIFHTDKNITGEYCFNDLTVSSRGDVYLTESLTNRIFILPAQDDSIHVFAQPEGYTFLNGVTLSPDEKTLFISSTESLLRLNIASGNISPIPYQPSISPSPIDGLAFFQNSLIGHQSKKVSRFYLNEAMDAILHHETIDSIGLDGSTTGELGPNGWYYYISNSQLSSGIDYAKMEIMPWDSLEAVVIRKVKL